MAGFTPSADAAWATGPVALRADWVVCHGDFGPWNIVWQDTTPVGIIDWDYARPGPQLSDVAYAAEYTSPFRDDAQCLESLRYSAPPDRRRRLELLCAAYGLPACSGVVDAVIRNQRDDIDLVRSLAEQGREPQATWVGEGYLGDLEERLAWSVANRDLFG